MPMPASVMQKIFNSALAALTNPSKEHRSYQLALSLNRQYDLNPEQSGYRGEQGLFTAVWNIVKSAISSHSYSGLMGTDPSTPARPPKIPGITPEQPQYLYRTVVSIRLPDGSRATTAIDVRSDTQLGTAEVSDRAMEIAANYTYQWGDTEGARRVRELIPDNPATVHIVSAGRRE